MSSDTATKPIPPNPTLVAEIDGLIEQIKAIHEAHGRAITSKFKRARKGRTDLLTLSALGIEIPEDLRALYWNWNGVVGAGRTTHWDEEVLYQSQQSALYNQVLQQLASKKLSYHCRCTRAQIKAIGGIYQGHCRQLNLDANQSATRVINAAGIYQYKDLIQGQVICNKQLASRIASYTIALQA